MTNHGTWPLRLAALALLALTIPAGLAWTQQTETPAELKARLAKLDKGPKTIDVSKYPDSLKAGYALFQKKCSKCHVPARPINSRFVLPGEWERYIKRMVYKPDSKMTATDGKTIYRFLVYDSSVRKADSLRVHLAALPSADREVALGKVKALNPAFTMEK